MQRVFVITHSLESVDVILKATNVVAFKRLTLSHVLLEKVRDCTFSFCGDVFHSHSLLSSQIHVCVRMSVLCFLPFG
jgi:hypothetical protein